VSPVAGGVLAESGVTAGGVAGVAVAGTTGGTAGAAAAGAGDLVLGAPPTMAIFT